MSTRALDALDALADRTDFTDAQRALLAETRDPARRERLRGASTEVKIGSVIGLGIKFALRGKHVAGRFEGVEALLRELSARVRDLEALVGQQAAQVKELSERATLHDGGIWEGGQPYEAGAVVTRSGSAWVCEEPHVSGAEFDHGRFRLMVKRGRDGR